MKKISTALLESMANARVLVVGDAGIDRYTEGRVERISPEAPVPIVSVSNEWLKLGLAANVAENIVRLGGQCDLVAVVGDDADGRDLARLVRDAGIESAALVVEKGRKTTLKERIVCDGQQIVRVDHETRDSLKKATARTVLAEVERRIGGCGIVVVQDYAKGVFDQDLLRAIFKLARRKGVRVFVDPHMDRPAGNYRGATLLTPNRREAESLSGVKLDSRRKWSDAGQQILRRTNSPGLVLTLGADGMAVFEGGKKRPELIPTAAREVFDVSGAGDTVVATLALASASGATLSQAARVANLAAGIVVGKRGTASVSREELARVLDLESSI